MRNDAATNGSTLAHEMGHYFNLFHTHEIIFGEEGANGSNCRTAGDLLCDTPADPDLSRSGAMGAGCTYVGQFTDASFCGNNPYVPDTHNLMSYAPSNCRTDFTQQQLDKMNYTLTEQREELLKIGVQLTNVINSQNAGGTLEV